MVIKVAQSPLAPDDTRGVLPRRSMRAHIWDLADEGIETVFERLIQNQVDGLHLSLIHHGGRFYCPHNPRHSFVHAMEGAKDGVLAHTWSSARRRRYWFNGREGGEVAAYAIVAGHDHGVPIIMTTAQDRQDASDELEHAEGTRA